jgi:hypothetical protein
MSLKPTGLVIYSGYHAYMRLTRIGFAGIGNDTWGESTRSSFDERCR